MKIETMDGVKIVRLEKSLPDEEVDKLCGDTIDETYIDHLIKEDTDVYKPDGTLLMKYRKGIVPANLCAASYPVFKGAAKPTDHRGMAAGFLKPEDIKPGMVQTSKFKIAKIKKDGTISKIKRAKVVESSIIGYFERTVRNPYCRITAYNLANEERFAQVIPFIQFVDNVFRDLVPERWEAQMEIVRNSSPDFYIHGTSFTTLSVNRNFRTAIHKDQGDLKEGFGVLSVLRAGDYTGGYLTWPKYKVGVDLGTGDVICCDVHEWHGNTPIYGPQRKWERISLVFYYREAIKECGTAEEELERAKRAQGTLK